MGEGIDSPPRNKQVLAVGTCSPRRSPSRHNVIQLEERRLLGSGLNSNNTEYHPRKPPLPPTPHALVLARRYWAWISLGLGLTALLLLLNYPRGRLDDSSTTKLLADDPGVKNKYECLADTAFLDYGPAVPGLTQRQCANLCYSMPNCRVWTMVPGDECLVHYSNQSALSKPGVTSCVQSSHRGLNMSDFLGVAHWQGCYFTSDKPFLLDGAIEIKKLGSRVIKVAFNFHAPWSDYPWHSPQWPKEEWKSWTPEPVDLAKHTYYKQLFEMDFDTYVLITYSNVARSTGPDDWRAWLDPWYWIYKMPTPAQLKDEMEQFYRLTEHLLTAYEGKTFILQIWEGDWTLRQDLPVDQRYNVTAPVSREKTDRMVRWLEARQKGVSLARSAVGKRAKSKVYHAAEVNLVKKTLEDLEMSGKSERNDMVTAVLPRVALDMVSYSSYDTAVFENSSASAFLDAMELIKRQHRRTAASPKKAVFIGEFGVSSMNTNWDVTMEKLKDAVNMAAAAGMRHLIYWQIYDNSLNPAGKEHYGIDHCDERMLPKGPVYDQKFIEGYFMIHPDFLYLRPPASYFRKMIHGEWDST